MVVQEASINNIMGGLEGAEGVKLHTHRRKLKQRFDIIKKLGQGTYGKVQLGINKETGQEVAIKTIKKAKIETEGDLIRIRREIQIMSSLRHPYIIHIYEVFENKDKIVLVMEYSSGGELYDYLSQRKVLQDTEAQRLFRQIAMAVYYCHKHQICHRDLKLENILLDEDGNAKLADFGLSNVFDSSRLLSTFCGSPLYASPEIVSGIPYYGPEVDCWSLGVLLYTLVYGAMPFDGSNFKRLVKQISHGEYYEPKVPSSASGLIRALLTVDGSERLDIVGVCSHAWLNSNEKETPCVKKALELSAEKPVRLDLLLSLNQPRNQPSVQPQTKPSVVKSRSVGSLPTSVKPTTPAPSPQPQAELVESKAEKESKGDKGTSDEVPAESIPAEQPADKAKKKSSKKPQPESESLPQVPQTPVKKPAKKTSKKPLKEPDLEEETLTVEKQPESSHEESAADTQVTSHPETSTEPTPKQEEPSTAPPPVPEDEPPLSPVEPTSPVKDFKLASTVHLDELIRSEIGSSVEPSSPLERLKKENALKVISHAISESAMSGERKSSTLPRRRLSRPEVSPPVAPAWRSGAPGTAPVGGSVVPNARSSQFVYPTPAPRTSLSMKESKEDTSGGSTPGTPRERIIPIAVEGRESSSSVATPTTPVPATAQAQTGPVQSSTTPAAHPMPRQSSVRASSLSREGSDSGSSVSSLSMKGEPVRKSPREVIIPIAMEGGGYLTPPLREEESSTSTSAAGGTSTGSRVFGLASTRPPRPSMIDTQDSLSSDEDDDNFEILTAENLFSTLLSRVRSLTQRLNDDTGRATAFPRLFSHESVFDNPSWSRRRGLLSQHRLGSSSISADSDGMLSRASPRLLEELPSRISSDDLTHSFSSRPSRFSSATLPRARVTVHVPLVEKD